MTIRVLVVDDSAVVRKILTDVLTNATGIEVMGTAQDPIFAMQRMAKEKPDVIVLDVEMPRMDGLTFLKKIMLENPIPVVMCSTLTEKSSRVSVKALSLGAVDVVAKPKMDLKRNLGDAAKLIVDAVRGAAKANLKHVKRQTQATGKPVAVSEKLTADAVVTKVSSRGNSADKIVAIGTSTGGTQALEVVLPRLTGDCPGVVVVQHMPEAFTAAFAERLNSICQVEVKEGRDGDQIQRGRVIIAPGGKHMVVNTKAALPHVSIKEGPLVSRHRPSVDVLFRSVAQSIGKKALGIIMTGMGDDGANGLKEMKEAGAQTLAQDESTCVIYGMPAVAVQRGAVGREVPLHAIFEEIQAFACH